MVLNNEIKNSLIATEKLNQVLIKVETSVHPLTHLRKVFGPEYIQTPEKEVGHSNEPMDQGIKIFKNGPSKICGRQPFKNSKWYGLPKQTISLQIF